MKIELTLEVDVSPYTYADLLNIYDTGAPAYIRLQNPPIVKNVKVLDEDA